MLLLQSFALSGSCKLSITHSFQQCILTLWSTVLRPIRVHAETAKRARSPPDGPWPSANKRVRTGGRTAGAWANAPVPKAPSTSQLSAESGSPCLTSYPSISTAGVLVYSCVLLCFSQLSYYSLAYCKFPPRPPEYSTPLAADRARGSAAFQTQQSASLSSGGAQEPVKRKRGRPPKPGGPTLCPQKPNIPRTGPALVQHIAHITESSIPQ